MKRILNCLSKCIIAVTLSILIGLIVYIKIKSLLVAIIIGLLSCVLLVYITYKLYLLYETKKALEKQKKYRYLIPEEIRGLDPKLDEAIDLDRELINFLDKYSSGKKTDLKETRLNEEWSKKRKYFVKKADRLFSSMNNEQLLNTVLATEQICNIVDIFEYFEPFDIDPEYFLEHPEKLTEAYYVTLSSVHTIITHSINPYYLKKLEEKNHFDEIERFILSHMSNEQIMELSNKSKNWHEKLYFYGYLKKTK